MADQMAGYLVQELAGGDVVLFLGIGLMRLRQGTTPQQRDIVSKLLAAGGYEDVETSFHKAAQLFRGPARTAGFG